MIATFAPRLDRLPAARQHLWPQLRGGQDFGLVLYDGTAIALRLGHRDSVDFDFFTERQLDRGAIKAAFPFAVSSTTLQDHENTWTVLVSVDGAAGEHVKVSFFGAITFGRVGEPELTGDGDLKTLTVAEKTILVDAVKAVRELADAALLSTILIGCA